MKSIINPSIYPGKTIAITVHFEVLVYSTHSTRVVPNIFDINLNDSSLPDFDLDANINFDPYIEYNAEIKFMGRMLSCLMHMSNYNDDEAQFGVIDNLCKVGYDNFVVAKSPTIHQILHMQPPNDAVLVDLSMLSDVPLIFGTDVIDEIHRP